MEKEIAIMKQNGELSFKLYELKNGDLCYRVNGKLYEFREFEKAIELTLENMTPYEEEQDDGKTVKR